MRPQSSRRRRRFRRSPLSRSAGPDRSSPTVWALRIIWILLPVLAGPAVTDALNAWSTAPRTLAEGMLWAAWAVTLVGLLAPRPIGLTLARLTAPTLLLLAVATAWSTPAATAAIAIVTTGAAAILVTRPEFSRASAEGVAYGDELRFPLKVPPALVAGPVPLATVLVAAGIVAGPLLLASGHVVAGIAATLAGVPLGAFLFRSLHGLSQRWIVLVPAGVTIVDRMTLADPVLFTRDRIAGLTPAGLRVQDGALDLRLGASVGSLALELTDDAQILTAARPGRAAEKVTTRIAVFTPVQPEVLRDVLSRRGQREST
jgi:hypothetical protein